MEYTNITSLVPEGEQFDSTAVNEGVWVTEAHLQNVENSLAENATAIADHTAALENLNGQLTAANTATETAEGSLVTANDTIVAKDAEIQRLNARIAELENGTPDPAQTKKDADETGSTHVKKESPMDAFADKLLGTPKPKQG